MRRSRRSAAQTETLDELAVAVDVDIGEVAEQTTTLTDEEEQATTRVVVVLVLLQVLGEVLDSLREERDLDLGGSSVTGVGRVLFDDRLLDIGFKCHRWDPLSPCCALPGAECLGSLDARPISRQPQESSRADAAWPPCAIQRSTTGTMEA